MKHPHLSPMIVLQLLHDIYVLRSPEDTMITIITSDTDYLQIACPQIKLITLKYKPVNTEKNSYEHSRKRFVLQDCYWRQE